MALERFEKNTAGDNFRTEDHLGKTFYVKPLEVFTGLVTKHDATGEKEKMRAHLYDVAEGKAYANVVLFNDGIRDGLKKYINGCTVIKFIDRRNNKGTATYRTIDEVDAGEFSKAEAMVDNMDKAIDARVAELAAGPVGTNQSSEQAEAVKGAFTR